MANLFQRASLIYPGESVSMPLRRLVAVMLSIILSLLCSAGRSEPLTMLLMPIERAETADAKPFTKARNFFPNLEFDNPEEQWQELNIGYHHWLCTELEKYAKEAGERIHIRFVSWNRALHDIIETYRGGYDVLAVPSTWTAHLIDMKILAAWDDIDEANYPAQLLKTCRIEGEKDIYAVPWQSDLRVLFYRSDLTNNPDRLVTFKGFRECLEERRQQMQNSPDPAWRAPFGVSVDRNWDVLHNLLAPFFGGHIIEKRQGKLNRISAYALGHCQWKAVFNTAQARKGFEKFLLLARDDLVHFTSSDQATGQIGWCNLAYGLIEGRYDAVIGGHYMRVLFDNRPDVDIRAAPLPQIIPGQPYSFMGGTHLAVAKAASQRGNEDLARKLVLYLTRPEALAALIEKTDSLPAHNHAFNNFIQRHPRWEAFRTTLDFAQPYPSIPEWADKVERKTVLNDFHMLLDSIAKGEEYSQVYTQLNKAAVQLQELLNQGHLPIAILLGIAVTVVVVLRKWLLSPPSKPIFEAIEAVRDEAHQDRKGLMKSTEEIRKILMKLDLGELAQQAPAILHAMEAAKQETIHEFGGLKDNVGRKFNSLSQNLEFVVQEIKGLRDASKGEMLSSNVKQAETLGKLENLIYELDLAGISITEIVDLVDKTPSSLGKIENWAKSVRDKIDKIYKKTCPEMILSKDCELTAKMKYERGGTKLQLQLLHDGPETKVFHLKGDNWTERVVSLFHLLMLRRLLSDKKTVYVYLSDYYLFQYPHFSDLKNPVDTTSHYFAKIRREVHSAIPSRVIITDRDERTVQREQFMLARFGEKSIDRRAGQFEFDDTRTSSDQRLKLVGPPEMVWIPEYTFVLPEQLKKYDEHILDPDDLQQQDSKVLKDVCKWYTEMLLKKAKMLDCMKGHFGTEEGKNKLIALNEIDKDNPEQGQRERCQELCDLGKVCKNIALKLTEYIE